MDMVRAGIAAIDESCGRRHETPTGHGVRAEREPARRRLRAAWGKKKSRRKAGAAAVEALSLGVGARHGGLGRDRIEREHANGDFQAAELPESLQALEAVDEDELSFHHGIRRERRRADVLALDPAPDSRQLR